MKKILSLLVVISGTLLLTNCGSQSTDTPATTASFASIYTTVLSGTCIQCHVPGTNVYNAPTNVKLDFTNASTAYNTLTSNFVAGLSSTGTCGGIRIVASGAPTASYLAGVLFNDYHIANFAGKGGCTPYANHLSDQNVSAAEVGIIGWINGGALNN